MREKSIGSCSATLSNKAILMCQVGTDQPETAVKMLESGRIVRADEARYHFLYYGVLYLSS